MNILRFIFIFIGLSLTASADAVKLIEVNAYQMPVLSYGTWDGLTKMEESAEGKFQFLIVSLRFNVTIDDPNKELKMPEKIIKVTDTAKKTYLPFGVANANMSYGGSLESWHGYKKKDEEKVQELRLIYRVFKGNEKFDLEIGTFAKRSFTAKLKTHRQQSFKTYADFSLKSIKEIKAVERKSYKGKLLGKDIDVRTAITASEGSKLIAVTFSVKPKNADFWLPPITVSHETGDGICWGDVEIRKGVYMNKRGSVRFPIVQGKWLERTLTMVFLVPANSNKFKFNVYNETIFSGASKE